MHRIFIGAAARAVALGLVCIAGSAPRTAKAAAVTWTAGPTSITSANDISLTGVLVHAGSWANVAVVTVGGQNISFASRPANGFDGLAGANGIPFAQAGVYAGNTGDANFNAVLGGFSYQTAPLTVLLGGLTVGNPYQVQFFISDDRFSVPTEKLSDSPTDGVGHETAIFNQNTHPFVIGTFTADASTQSFFGLGNGAAVINGYVLRTVVPEPGALAIASGLITAGLGWRRRHRR